MGPVVRYIILRSPGELRRTLTTNGQRPHFNPFACRARRSVLLSFSEVGSIEGLPAKAPFTKKGLSMDVQGSLLQASHVVKEFAQGGTKLAVLRGISASFQQGKMYAITGVSGAGKSTLLQLLAGLDVPTHGLVTFNGMNLQRFSARERGSFLNTSIGLVFQVPYSIRELSVLENIMLYGLIAGQSYETCAERARGLLKTVGLEDKADARPAALSGGQQQRVAILRALFNKPAFLLADEPTGNLDEETGRGITQFLLDCQKEWKIGLIISTHDMAVAGKMEKILRLHDGQLAERKE